MERLSIESFLQNGHEYDLYTYGPVDNVPGRASVLDAGAVVPFSMVGEFRCAGSVCAAAFSDAFRFKLLLDRGGVWADTDVVCLRPFDLEEDYCFPLLSGFPMLGREPGFSIDSWFLKAPQGSAFLRYCHDVAMTHAGRDLVWGQIGPLLIKDAIDRFALHRFARGPTFFPVNYDSYKLFTDGSALASVVWHLFSRYSIALHLYHEMWREAGIDKDASFPNDCIYERLKRRYAAA